jgi:hypothetical protein
MSNGAGDLTLGYTEATVAGSADAQALAVENLTGGTFIAAGIETLNLTARGARSTGVILSNTNNFATVNISGAAALGLDIQDTAVKTVNGSAATGALTLDVSDLANVASATSKVTVSGGSANDEFLLENKLDADVLINGNAGVNTLTLTGGLTTANATGVSNIQVIKAVDAAASGSPASPSYDLNAISSATTFDSAVKGFTTTTAADATAKVTNFNNSDSLVVSAGNERSNTTVEFQTNTTSNVLSAAINGVTFKNLTANDAETVNLASNVNPTSSADKNKIDGTASFTEATSVVVNGANDLTIDALALSEPSNGLTVSYNSSAFTGKSDVTFTSGGNQIITTGSNNDIVKLKDDTLDGFDNINLGGGTNVLKAKIGSSLGILNITNAQEVEFTLSADASAFLGNNTALQKLLIDTGTGSGGSKATISGVANNATATILTDGTQAGKQTVQYSPGSTTGNLVLAGTTTPIFGEVQVNNVSTLNLSTVDTSALDPAVLSKLTADALLTTLNINSTAAVTLDESTNTANLATINASQSSGDITVGAGVARTTTASITGGSGSDKIGLNVNTQSLNTINAGSGTDTLILTGTGNAAVTVVDLSSTTDQLVSINGQINSAVQRGFENLTATALSSGTGFGVNVTAASGTTSVKTTAQADDVTGNSSAAATYELGAGVDVFTGTSANEIVNGGTGGDQLAFGSGTDTAVYTTVNDSATATSSPVTSPVAITTAYDVLTGLGAGDKISVAGLGDTGINGLTSIGTSLATAATDAVNLVQGTFASGTFTSGTGASANDYLFQYANGTNITSVLLVDTGVLASSTISAGVVTL